MVVKKEKDMKHMKQKDITSILEDSSTKFVNTLGRRLGSKIKENALTPGEAKELLRVIEENENYFISHENKDSISSAAFSLYDLNRDYNTAVLRVMESQIPSSYYNKFSVLASSASNHERAQSIGVEKDEKEDEYFSNADTSEE